MTAGTAHDSRQWHDGHRETADNINMNGSVRKMIHFGSLNLH